MDRTIINSKLATMCFAIALVCLDIIVPSQAAAHLVTTGMGTVYDGIGHLLMTPKDILPAIAVAMYAGLRGKDISRLTLFLFPLSWFLGGVVGLIVSGISPPPVQILSLCILGGLVAADISLPKPAILVVHCTIGGIHGFFNGTNMTEGSGVSGMLGIAATLFVLVAIVAAIISTLRLPWTRVAVRVVGSWLAAIGILLLGWMLKGVS